MSEELIKNCPECNGPCGVVFTPESGMPLVACEVEGCYFIGGKTRELAVRRHNAIPRWRSYTDPPAESGVYWVAYHGGYDKTGYNARTDTWTTLTGTRVRILKWTEFPADLPCVH